ncbi:MULTISPECIES: ABC transporter substrate-binding protein [Clostridia]|uniref:ABC transporter substrate-binding protein n=1 Tax=Lacrimispora celerecrescens TaxID=29354 RepID=A0A084JNB7_9FIRM|nr:MULTISPECIES: extracellular solute-binding protein [Clostridia]KEZ90451.1 ABC transporter substrate-binding protein [Lacrimispora celerecrescens]MBW4846508.1 extracellular solute-binding protein [Lachnospiraceae bacterium]MSS10191.1 extracellular solute-binding protein [Clostridium sp. WB02_MRS01]CUX49906.1 Multiple sugar-binding protein precursor [Clostridium sp. C105KSO15]
MKIKKVMALTLAGVLSLSMLTACGSKTDSAGKELSDEKVTIRLLTRMAGTSTQVGIYNDIINEFKSKHPEVTIIDDSQGDESAFNNILTTDIASGTMANIFRIQGVANLSDYIDNGLLLNLQPYLDADKEWSGGFTEGSLSYYQVPGHEGTYAIPMESGLIGVYYNEMLFKKAGIEKFPETWEQLLDAIAKLKENGIIPIAMGAQSTYMAGHLHDQIFYKWMGTEAAKLLGNREMKWTDEGVVQTLQFEKDLIDAGAFDPSAAGITDNIALTQFQQGEAAMVITGPWNISTFTDKSATPVSDNVKVAKFPYFEEKPEFKNQDMQILSPYMVSGKLEGKELDLTIELLKMLTGKEAAKRFAEEAAFLIPRTDLDLDKSKCTDLFMQNVEIGGTSEGIGVDVFDFDPLTSMQDRTRNSIVSLFTGASAQDAAAVIQAEIDHAK